jgi:hypothetical protein
VVINISMNLPSRFFNVVFVCRYFVMCFFPYPWWRIFLLASGQRNMIGSWPSYIKLTLEEFLLFSFESCHFPFLWFLHLLHHVHINPKNNVNLVFSNIRKNLLAPFIFSSPKISFWNRWENIILYSFLTSWKNS